MGSMPAADTMPRNGADPRVDAYIEALPEWQQTSGRQVRDLVHAADPELPRPRPLGHVQADHREQPGRGLEEAEVS